MSEAFQLWSSTSASVEPLGTWTPRIMQRTEQALERYLPPGDMVPTTLHDGMRNAPMTKTAAARAACPASSISTTKPWAAIAKNSPRGKSGIRANCPESGHGSAVARCL